MNAEQKGYRFVIGILAVALLSVLVGISPINQNESSTKFESENGRSTIAFFDVNVIPMDPDGMLERQTVLVENGRITRMGSWNSFRIPYGIEVIDCKGEKFLMPGLADMHGHMQWLRFNFGADRFDIYDLYITSGVTTVFNMIGFDTMANQITPTTSILELKRRLNAGEEFGPRLYSASNLIFDNFTPTVDATEDQIRRYVAEGWDVLKLVNPLHRDKYLRAVQVANELDIRITGHYPRQGVSLDEFINLGFHQISHVMELTVSAYPNYTNTFVDIATDAEIVAVGEKLLAADTWLTPTTALSERTFQRADPETLKELQNAGWMKYVPPAVRNNWANATSRFSEKNWWGRIFPFQYRQTKIFFDMGVKLLVGGDPELPYKLHGESLLEEIEGFANKAGIPNYDVLKIATYNAAMFNDNLDEQGVIREGMSPDFILLNSNPIDDISNVRDLEGVMLRGRWLDRSDLDARLERLEKKFAAPEAQVSNSRSSAKRAGVRKSVKISTIMHACECDR